MGNYYSSNYNGVGVHLFKEYRTISNEPEITIGIISSENGEALQALRYGRLEPYKLRNIYKKIPLKPQNTPKFSNIIHKTPKKQRKRA